jgi:hypothetical protein
MYDLVMKLKFLLIEDNARVQEILKKNCEESFGAEVVSFSLASEALNVFTPQNDFNLVICRNDIAEEKTASLIINHIFDHKLNALMIVIGEFENPFKKYINVSDKLRIEEVNRSILKQLGMKKEDFKFLKLPDYVGYSIQYFFNMQNAPCDIFIKLSKKDGDEFVKRLHVGENFNRDDLEKYSKLGVSELFILKEDCDKFLNAMLLQTVKQIKEVKGEEKVAVLENTFAISQNIMTTVGITPQAKILADQTIAAIADQVSKTDQLGKLLKKILDNNLSFSYRRSYLNSLLIATILPKLDWVSGEQLQNILLKMTMVSYFHDIYLEDETFLRVMNQEEFKKIEKRLVGVEKELILNHAHRAASLLQSYPKLPNGVDMIVKQHHGVTNGVGFPEIYSSSLTPLSILFIVVEEYAHQILISDEQLDLEKINEQMLKKFSLPSYRKIAEVLASLSKKPKKSP